MAVTKINNIEYDVKELRIKEDKIEMLLSDDKDFSLGIPDCKVLEITLSGNIKKCKVNGSLSVTGNVCNGIVSNILILDGYMDTSKVDVPIVRLNEASLSKIGFYGSKDNTLKIDVLGTLENFESENRYTIVEVHGTIGRVECGRSLRVCGNLNDFKVGKQVIGNESFVESSFERQKREMETKKKEVEISKIVSDTSLDFK